MNGEEQSHDLNALAAHLEGRLRGPDRDRVIEHLAGCRDCREAAALLARSWPSVKEPARDRAVPVWLARAARSPWLAVAAVLVVATTVGIQLAPTASPVPRPVAVPGSSPASRLAESPVAGGSREASAVGEATAAPTPPSRRTAPPQAAIDESLLVRRGAARRVAGKTFRLVAGEWVDASFDRTADLPVVEVAGPAEREEILARVPGLAPYATLGDRVLVVFEGTLYRFRPAGSP